MAKGSRQRTVEKNGSSASSGSEDAPKKSPKVNGAPGPGVPGTQSRGSCLGVLASAVFYLALVGAAGVAAFYSQQVVEEMRQNNAKNEESAGKAAELSVRMEQFTEQVVSLSRVVDGLESSLGVTRVELEGTSSRVKRSEAETRRLDDGLQKLQNELLRELADAVAEVKRSRESDFSSLERTVEERLAEVSASITGSVAVFGEAQDATRSQLEQLKARLDSLGNNAGLKQEVDAIAEAVVELKASGERRDAAAASLGAQVGAVRSEFQTRNQEVASLSGELEAVRDVVQETIGGLKGAVHTAEDAIHTLTEQGTALQADARRVDEALRDLRAQLSESQAETERRWAEVEGKVKTLEESEEFKELRDKMDALVGTNEKHDDLLSAHRHQLDSLKVELHAATKSAEELWTSILSQETKLEGLETLKTAVEQLETRTAKHEDHELAIQDLQNAVKTATQSLAKLVKPPQKKN